MYEFERVTALDFVLTPLVAGLIYFTAKRYRDRHYPIGHAYHPYFLPALGFKLAGAIAICLIYVYYYDGGDTVNYFYHAQVINSSLVESPAKWFNLVFAIPSRFDPEYFEYTQLMEWYGRGSPYTVAQFAAVFSLFTLNTFIPASLLFAGLAFTGIWALFVTFAKQFPHLREPIATAILFIPSVAMWGSGIFKDTLCMFSLGWLTYGTFQFFVNENRSARNTILIVASFLLLAALKVYIVICFVPALIGWVIFKRTSQIQGKSLVLIVNLSAAIFILGIFGVLFSQFSDFLGKYSLENIQKTSESTRRWLTYMSNVDNGSAYDLGDFDPSIGGMLSKFPLAVNVTLFRPYIWESRKVIIFFNALESLIILLLTIRVIFVVGIRKVLQSISTNYTIQFCFIFAIMFAFAVGISSYNFGALSRYKIPCIPFYILTLVLIFYRQAPPGQRLMRRLRL
jgi:hypothetical protein